MILGLFFALLSGVTNGLFTAPMKIIPRWKWENIWLVFIVTSCLVIPAAVVGATIGDARAVFAASPGGAVRAALAFGFAWGFGAILFGMSVDRLGVSLANTLVIGLSSALGSLVPLVLQGAVRMESRLAILMLGVGAFLVGVRVCGGAGRLRDASASSRSAPLAGYLFAIGSGMLSAIFNIGYSLAQPIAEAGLRLGYPQFQATNCIWLLMLSAGSIPNLAFCGYLLRRHRTAVLFRGGPLVSTLGLSVLMGVLWGASIFFYGAATPLLGDIGPSIGWPLSLAVGLLVANLMGMVLGEWRTAPAAAVRQMRTGILTLLVAIVLCAFAAKGD